jgi:hypothetical protein
MTALNIKSCSPLFSDFECIFRVMSFVAPFGFYPQPSELKPYFLPRHVEHLSRVCTSWREVIIHYSGAVIPLRPSLTHPESGFYLRDTTVENAIQNKFLWYVETLLRAGAAMQVQRIELFKWLMEYCTKVSAERKSSPPLRIVTRLSFHTTFASAVFPFLADKSIADFLRPLKGLDFGGINLYGCPDEALSVLSELTSLEFISFCATNISTDTGLKHISHLPSLTELNLSSNGLWAKDDLRHLSSLPSLRKLDLSFTQVCDEAMSALAPIKTLQWLDISNSSNLNGDGLQYLSELPNLQYLNLNQNSGIESSAFVHLKNVTSLRELYCAAAERSWDNAFVTNESLKSISGLFLLERLDLTVSGDSSEITDVGLEYLTNLRNLTYLNLTGMHLITLNGLMNLVHLSLLEEVIVAQTMISESDFLDFMKALQKNQRRV